MKRLLMGALFAAAMFALPGGALADQSTAFQADLSGDAQVPVVFTDASGEATFQLSPDRNSLSYTLTVGDISQVFVAHIHLGAAGTNGPVVVFLYGPTAPTGEVDGTLASGTITATNLTGPLTGQNLSALIDALTTGMAYVNVHTVPHPGGEIRGQVEPED